MHSCLKCKKEFKYTYAWKGKGRAGVQKYCSKECYLTRGSVDPVTARERHNKSRKSKNLKTLECPVCRKSFTQVRTNQVACSKECRYKRARKIIYEVNEANRERLRSIPRKCEQCGRDFLYSKVKRRKYCGMFCAAEARDKKQAGYREMKRSARNEEMDS